MKKIVMMIFILATLSTYTIVRGNIEEEVKITVTADKKTTFDMFHSTKGILKGLTTPYEMKFTRTDSRFIFKSQKTRTNLKIKVELDNKTALTADWPITVLVVSKGSLETFGME